LLHASEAGEAEGFVEGFDGVGDGFEVVTVWYGRVRREKEDARVTPRAPRTSSDERVVVRIVVPRLSTCAT
jgi:hypothetical protein